MRKLLYWAAAFALTLTTTFAQQAYDIRLNLNPPIKVPLRQTMKQEQLISFSGQEMKVSNTVRSEFVFSVTEKKGDNYMISAIINKIEGEGESMGQTFKMSSEDATETEQNKELKKITHKVVQAEVTPYFELVGEPVAVTEGTDAATAKQVINTFTGVMSGMYHAAVKKGESWTVTEEEAHTTTTYTLTDVTEGSFLVTGKVKLEGEFQGVAMSGEGNLNVELDRATGVPIYGLMTLPLAGSMMAQGTMVNVKADSTTSFELAQ